MSIASGRFGGIADIVETIPAAAGSAAPVVRNIGLGASAAAPTTPTAATLTPGTGTAVSINQVVDGVFSLAGGATLIIDLNSFTATTGTKTLTKCRGFRFINTAAADAGAGYNFTVNATASNGFTAGGQIPPSTAPATVAPNSELTGSNLNAAGWTVSASVKTMTVTAGASGATGYFLFFGE